MKPDSPVGPAYLCFTHWVDAFRGWTESKQRSLLEAEGWAQKAVSFQGNNGLVVYMPLASLQTVLHSPGEVNNYWVVASSTEHAFIDRLTTRLEDTLGAHGTQITTAEMIGHPAARLRWVTTTAMRAVMSATPRRARTRNSLRS